MLLKLNRTQTTALGQLRANVIYDFDMRKRRHKEVADTLSARKFAAPATKKDLEAQKGDLAARQAAAMAKGGALSPALCEALLIEEQEAAEAKGKKAAAAKAGADAEAGSGK
ncbi:hypothetical protein P775_14225 [Puniceibacterium antarcticum]|uniref:Uncharacterized protein n=1 Tax=Puniceibacterium antarcticum TaxID=1206336 RepID=A0A2G8RD48_9RHOB|nr:hypothetical protein [Puniceibacterium antarcticum]PIL19506.1 hypothetical protein P775_14225 [Puniceibacterium antarcticum]